MIVANMPPKWFGASINYLFCYQKATKASYATDKPKTSGSDLGCTLWASGEHFKVPMPRLRPQTVKPEGTNETKTSHQYFLKVSRSLQCAARIENHCLRWKTSQPRFFPNQRAGWNRVKSNPLGTLKQLWTSKGGRTNMYGTVVDTWLSAFVKTLKTLQHRVNLTVYKFTRHPEGQGIHRIECGRWQNNLILL